MNLEELKCLYFCAFAEALQLQSEAFRSKRGHRPAQLEELWKSLEQWRGITAGQHGAAEPQGVYLHIQRMCKYML